MQYPKPTLTYWIMLVLSPLGCLSGIVVAIFQFADGLIWSGIGYLLLGLLYGALFVKMISNLHIQ